MRKQANLYRAEGLLRAACNARDLQIRRCLRQAALSCLRDADLIESSIKAIAESRKLIEEVDNVLAWPRGLTRKPEPHIFPSRQGLAEAIHFARHYAARKSA